jgi:hypothetical protein
MKSKRGVALAYVIVVTAALLVLAAAFIALAQYNLNASQTSLEGRQAYLDARSAIEFGKAYLAENPDTESFTIVRSAKAGSGFAINTTGTVVASYNSDNKQLSAKAPFKTAANRYRLLGYQFSGGGSGSGGAPADYLICGTVYGATSLFDQFDINNLRFGVNKKSDYPVVMPNILRGDTDWNTARSLTAPEIYMMGQPTSFDFYDNCYAEMHSNFICIGGSSITGYDDRASFTDPSHQYSALILKTNPSGGTGVICFLQDCTLQITGSLGRTVKIPKGYYLFSDSMNLIGLTASNFNSMLTKLDSSRLPSYVSTTRVNFISNNNTSFLVGGVQDWNHGAIWTDDAGVLANGHPTNQNNGGKPYSLSSNTVFFYITSCQNWEKSMTKWDDHDTAVYSSKSIYMRYVNSTDDFTIPAGKTIVYQSNKIWMNTAKSDTSLGGDVPIAAGDSGSQFVLQALSGSGGFELDVPAELTVNYKNLNGAAKSYRIKAGTYQLAQQINLFSDIASATLNASKSS